MTYTCPEPEYMTAGMSEEEILAAIQKSREQGWSELKEGAQDGALASRHAQANQVVWEELKKRDPFIFGDDGEEGLKLERLIAEGGQAQIFEASYYGEEDLVAKIFKLEGFSLAALKSQWPSNVRVPMVGVSVFDLRADWDCHIIRGTFLKDGRFVFVMGRAWGDLRTLIDLKLSDNNCEGPPFSHPQALKILYGIALSMRDIHRKGVLHRDLKAANVLVSMPKFLGGDPRYNEKYSCEVTDFETSTTVQGTGFWRAPEVLKELLKKPCDRNEEIWTEKADAYSFAMTCYEVLTGGIPFIGCDKSDWKRVIDGERPQLPDYVDVGVRELVERCWHKDPSEKPTFEVIHGVLGALPREKSPLCLSDSSDDDSEVVA